MTSITDTKNLEESFLLNLDFNKVKSIGGTSQSVLPAIIQHESTKEVLMLGYMNEKAFNKTMSSGVITFWSTSRNELWIKGGSSGNRYFLKGVFVNCEQNSLLFLAVPELGGICHTTDESGDNRSSCYYRKIEADHQLKFI